MVVSRWFVIPIAAISSADTPILFIASRATCSCVDQISPASCSTHPGFGKYCVNSFCATLHISPFSLNKMHLLLVVPASNAIIYFPIFFLLFYLIRSFQSILYYNVLHKKRPACFHAGLSLITDSHRVIYSYFSSSP